MLYLIAPTEPQTDRARGSQPMGGLLRVETTATAAAPRGRK